MATATLVINTICNIFFHHNLTHYACNDGKYIKKLFWKSSCILKKQRWRSVLKELVSFIINYDKRLQGAEILEKLNNKRSEVKYLINFRKKKSNEILLLVRTKVEQPI